DQRGEGGGGQPVSATGGAPRAGGQDSPQGPGRPGGDHPRDRRWSFPAARPPAAPPAGGSARGAARPPPPPAPPPPGPGAPPARARGARATVPRRAGLSGGEVAERRAEGLTNAGGEQTSRSVAHILRANILTRFNLILGVLLVVILAVGQPQDALFGVVLVTNALIGIVQELRAKRTLDRLALLTPPHIP